MQLFSHRSSWGKVFFLFSHTLRIFSFFLYSVASVQKSLCTPTRPLPPPLVSWTIIELAINFPVTSDTPPNSESGRAKKRKTPESARQHLLPLPKKKLATCADELVGLHKGCCLTENFTILEPQDPEINGFCALWKRPSSDFQAPKLWIVRSAGVLVVNSNNRLFVSTPSCWLAIVFVGSRVVSYSLRS